MIHLFKKPQDMTKSELVETMSLLQRRVDSGRHTGAEVQILRESVNIYIARYEGGENVQKTEEQITTPTHRVSDLPQK